MSSGFMRPLLRRAWWWVFSILIAGPALVLALFGLRAIMVDRIEREQQTQVARLADAAIANAVERLIAQLDRMGIDSFTKPAQASLERPDLEVFILDAGDVLSFPLRRIYFGKIGQRPEFLRIPGELSPTASRLIAEGQAMEAQRRRAEAIALYRQARLFSAESRLSEKSFRPSATFSSVKGFSGGTSSPWSRPKGIWIAKRSRSARPAPTANPWQEHFGDGSDATQQANETS